jgi:hypothetical protein
MGVALGASGARSWFSKHFVSPERLLQAKGLL